MQGRRRAVFLISAAVALFAALGVVAGSFMPAAAQEAETIEEQVDGLIERMTLEEKVGQLNQYSGFWDATGPAPEGKASRAKLEHLRNGMVGAMLNVVGVEQIERFQRIAVKETRLSIPLLFGYDVVHGYRTIFPIPLAEAASWDLAMIEETARIAAREAAAQGINWTFAPMVDISRDARWGRVMEGAGEDPYIGSAIAKARVRGFQGTDLSAPNTIAATAKHFAGYGFAEAGRDYNPADIGSTTLHNVVLPPFRAAVEDAGVRTVMNSFNTLNAVPATGNAFLQREILKGKWNFDGFVVSDSGSGKEMVAHGFARDGKHAAELAIKAGSDMDMESYIYLEHLVDLVEEGVVEEAVIDNAVRRILTVKHELGLFEDPYRYIRTKPEQTVLYTEENRAAAREMAEESIVLLKNQSDLLPLEGEGEVAVIGALAAEKDSPLGNWRARGEADSAVSVLEGLEAEGVDFTYAEGAPVELEDAAFHEQVRINETDRSGFEKAVDLAENSDRVVMVLGEHGMQSGEGRSRAHLGLPGVQQELLEAVHAVNRNIVLVVMSGRPLVLTWADANVPAILQAWHLGTESGNAIARVLTGKHNPSGKLPMSFPRAVGQLPIYYNHLSTGRPGPQEGVFWSHYTDESVEPLYPFGHGLSYTDFAYDDLRVMPNEEGANVTVTVTNTGQRAGAEVAQLYIRDQVASVTRPVRELKGFERIVLEPGEARDITFNLTREKLGFYNTEGAFVVEPGRFEIFVGGSSQASLSESFTLE